MRYIVSGDDGSSDEGYFVVIVDRAGTKREAIKLVREYLKDTAPRLKDVGLDVSTARRHKWPHEHILYSTVRP